MTYELEVCYKGEDLVINFTFIKGKGWLNSLDPPEEDEIIIHKINGKDSYDYDHWELMEIERICLEKIK